MRIFLDLDGVLVDFIRGAAELFKKDYDQLISRWPPGMYDMEVVLGISKTKFFSTIENVGEDFWATLPPFPYAKSFYEHCEGIAPVCILTRPTYAPSCLSGKVRWMRRHFGNIDYIIGKRKELCARDTHVLIDDHTVNVSKFQEHGGRAILWPAINNPRHAESDRAVEIVKEELDRVAVEILTKGWRHSPQTPPGREPQKEET